MSYKDEMTQAMKMLASDPRTLFIGQAVEYPGTTMSGTLSEVSAERLIEFPVAEETQLGVSIGLALSGYVPISLFPRWNFLILATNQLVNHLDKIQPMPHVIVRVGVGSESPMYPGPQHVGNFIDAFRMICRATRFEDLEDPEQIVPAYRAALEHPGATVLVERAEMYN